MRYLAQYDSCFKFSAQIIDVYQETNVFTDLFMSFFNENGAYRPENLGAFLQHSDFTKVLQGRKRG